MKRVGIIRFSEQIKHSNLEQQSSALASWTGGEPRSMLSGRDADRARASAVEDRHEEEEEDAQALRMPCVVNLTAADNT